MGFTESIEALILSKKRTKVIRVGVATVAFLLALDFAGVIFLRLAPQLVDPLVAPVSWQWSTLGGALTDFTADTLDLILLFLVRAVALLVLGVLACRAGKTDYNGIGAAAETGGVAPLLAGTRTADGGSSVPTHHVRATPPSSGARAGWFIRSAALGRLRPSRLLPLLQVTAEHLQSHKRKQAAEMRKSIFVAAIFAISTAAQVSTTLNGTAPPRSSEKLLHPIKTKRSFLSFEIYVGI